jgi:glycosyltransferase involved in cell wall biosynthesis
MYMKISYGILTHNEGERIEKLIEQLLEIKRLQDEIIIIDDYSSDPATISVIEKYQLKDNIKLFHNHLSENFSQQKNFLNSKCTGDWIVNLDADELLSEGLKTNLVAILEQSESIDIIGIPRENYVEGITPEHLEKWKWRLDEKNRINYPDLQWRVYRNKPEIKWIKKIHEKLEGYQTYNYLPSDSGLDLLHIKDIEHQEKQIGFYNTIKQH